jgi:putative membrane protein
MNSLVRVLVRFVVAFHLLVFVVETFLWMHPGVHEVVLNRLTDTTSVDPGHQALILRALFVNQGFYNLFLAIAGFSGLLLLRRENTAAGYALIGYMCCSAASAGLVLAFSTRLYVGAFLQAAPPAVALALMLRSYTVNRRQLATHGC